MTEMMVTKKENHTMPTAAFVDRDYEPLDGIKLQNGKYSAADELC